MLIVCPSCATSYQIAPPALGENGRAVRCVRCKTVWVATAPALAEAAPGAAPGLVLESPPLEAQGTAADEPAQALPDNPANPDPAVIEAGVPTPGQAIDETPPPAVADSPPLAPADVEGPTLDNGPSPTHEDIETIAARREAAQRRFRLRIPLWAVTALLCAVSAALIGLRKDVVRHVPQLASFYATIGLPVNLRGLVFADVTTAEGTYDGAKMLTVEGAIVSTAAAPVDVPRLRFALRNAAGTEVYTWTAMPTRATLAPGGRLPFRSRLAAPPANGRDLEVRFFTRHDAAGR
ncbi:MAG: zinc-ribbon domain-containing protein [Rhizobiales bacterium]|nr:zinc-ribbon domain-containing protein [Hyphomicrobiales bacterium]